MALSAYTDGNSHLDNDKLAFTDADDYSSDVTSADRLIRAALTEIFGDVVSTWDINPTPPDVITPEIVIEISGLLSASYRYRKIYSEETTEVPAAAVELEQRAMCIVDDLRSGKISIDADTIAGTEWTNNDFYPNDMTIDLNGDPVRLFAITDVY
jgi:hypothetical protein